MSDSDFNGSQLKNRLRKGIGLRILVLKSLESSYIENKTITAYELQNMIYQMTHSLWKPSPGSIYPILDDLVEKNFVTVINRDNKDYYSLTEKGKEIFNHILSYKLMADIVLHTRIYDSFDLNSIQISLESSHFKQNFQEIESMVGMFVEKEGIESDKIQDHIIGIEKEIQKEKIKDIIKGIDNYIDILEAYQGKFIEKLNDINLNVKNKK